MKAKTFMTFMLSLMLLVTILSTGCLDDDSEKIVGTWVHQLEEDEEPNGVYVTFKSDGTGYFQRWADEKMEFEWEIIERGTILVGDDEGFDESRYRFENDDRLIFINPGDPDDEIEYVRAEPEDIELPKESEWLVGGLTYNVESSNTTAYEEGDGWQADARIQVTLDQPSGAGTEDVKIIMTDDQSRPLLDHQYTVRYSLLDDDGRVVTGTRIYLTIYDLVEGENISDYEVSMSVAGYDNKISAVIN